MAMARPIPPGGAARVGPEPRDHGKVRLESREEEATHVLDEARMVLPGIQALFGFQLVAVFIQRFSSDLAPWQQLVHLIALYLSRSQSPRS